MILTALRAALASTASVDSITDTVAGVETVCEVLDRFGVSDTREISPKLEASKIRRKTDEMFC
jgi:hypothetical protein